MTGTNDTQRAIDRAADDFVEFCRTAKREVITLSPEAFDAFVKRLEEPPQANPRLRALMNHKAPWE
jgi:uncharacterized protein (DUF1778 family)